jgi:MFS family permease
MPAHPLLLGFLQQSLGPAGQYLRVGWAIARFDKDAVQRAARDEHALRFGVIFLIIALLAYVSGYLLNPLLPPKDMPAAKYLAVVLGIVLGATLFVLAHFAVCHAALNRSTGRDRSLPATLRPLLLSAVALWLAFIPIIGFFALAYWWYAVGPWVCKEIHEVKFGKAFAVFYGTYIVLALPVMIVGLLIFSFATTR